MVHLDAIVLSEQRHRIADGDFYAAAKDYAIADFGFTEAPLVVVPALPKRQPAFTVNQNSTAPKAGNKRRRREVADLNFAKVRGKWVLTADDLANYFLNNKSGAFKSILFVDSSKQDPQAKLYENEACAIELRRLMSSQTRAPDSLP